MRPLIGISCSYDLKEKRYFLAEAYVEAVIKAGGNPVVLPGAAGQKNVAPYIAVLKGLVLAGGGDVDPSYFNEEPLPGLGEVTPERDSFEILLVKGALRQKLPILGICRGIQVLNVAAGGSLIQHIPSEIRRPLKHSQNAPRSYASHRVYLEKPSRLAEIMAGTLIRVNSFHHQAVREAAPGFSVTARSSDGVIEAIEAEQYPFVLGVQWHPECMISGDRNSRALFKSFLEAAVSGKRKK